MDNPDVFALVCIVLALLFFLGRAIFVRFVAMEMAEGKNFDEYLLASRQLGRRHIALSMAATYSAFATVFFWFIALGGHYSYLLLLIPAFLYVGNVIFLRILRSLGIELGRYRTIASYTHAATENRILQRSFDFIVFVYLFSALLVEIVIGSGILAALLPSVPGGQLLFITVISLLVIGYVVLGGYRAVILSDGVQFALAAFGMFALLLFAVIYLKSPTSGTSFFYTPVVTWGETLAFLVSVVTVQVFGPICQQQNWQRIAAARSQQEALSGHHIGTILGGVLWVGMIACTLVLYSKMEGAVNFTTIFAQMKDGGLVAAYGLYPLVMVGLVAAMISTADSAMTGLLLHIYDELRRRAERIGKSAEPTMKCNLLLGAALFAVILAVYYITKLDSHGFAITMIYFLFNQLIVVFPALVYLMVEQNAERQKGADAKSEAKTMTHAILVAGVVVGWLAVLTMTAIGHFTKSLPWIMYASGAGVAVASVPTLVCWFRLHRSAIRSPHGEQP